MSTSNLIYTILLIPLAFMTGWLAWKLWNYAAKRRGCGAALLFLGAFKLLALAFVIAFGGLIPVVIAVMPVVTQQTSMIQQPEINPVPHSTSSLQTAPITVPSNRRIQVGLVTDTGGVNDKGFNQLAWKGIQRAVSELGVEAKFIESKQPSDYEININQFIAANYDVIITVGFLMGDATAAKAKQYPNVKFAIVDYSYFPVRGDKYCPETVYDCYRDGGLSNVTSLMFQEDELGFLAGVVAGGMTKTGTVCAVAATDIPPVVRYVTGFQNGVKYSKSSVSVLSTYIPSFTDPDKGRQVAQSMIVQKCDVGFGVGGNTGNGALYAMKEKGLIGIGIDVDQYYTFPEVRDTLVTSAMKNVDVAIFNYLRSINNATVRAGISIANLQNGGVGLAPYHDWDTKVSVEIKTKVKVATENLINRKIFTGYKP